MLAYRHQFHAGNFADVFKHSLLAQLVLGLEKKDKPFFVLDTHAGIGRYDLPHEWAQKNAEHREGIALVWGRKDVPNSFVPYLDAIRGENKAGRTALLSRLAAHRAPPVAADRPHGALGTEPQGLRGTGRTVCARPAGEGATDGRLSGAEGLPAAEGAPRPGIHRFVVRPGEGIRPPDAGTGGGRHTASPPASMHSGIR